MRGRCFNLSILHIIGGGAMTSTTSTQKIVRHIYHFRDPLRGEEAPIFLRGADAQPNQTSSKEQLRNPITPAQTLPTANLAEAASLTTVIVTSRTNLESILPVFNPFFFVFSLTHNSLHFTSLLEPLRRARESSRTSRCFAFSPKT